MEQAKKERENILKQAKKDAEREKSQKIREANESIKNLALNHMKKLASDDDFSSFFDSNEA